VPAVLPDEGPLPETDFLTQVLIRDGNKLMREGDIAAAQRTYEKAAASNNPEAYLALGRSYDPTYFEKLNVKTGRPDPAKAFDSYKKALDGGLGGARAKIDALKQWLQR
jgi:TPR repeat protein